MVYTRLLINAKEASDFLAMAGSPHRLLILAHLLNTEMSVTLFLKRLDLARLPFQSISVSRGGAAD
jgi:hypothetical protein